MNKPKLLIEPSHWLQDGIQLEVPADLPLFKFSERLQARADELLLKSNDEHHASEFIQSSRHIRVRMGLHLPANDPQLT